MRTLLAVLFLGLFVGGGKAQQFSIQAYEEFLAAHKDMTRDQFLSLHYDGLFKSKAQSNYNDATYLDGVDAKYSLTADEKLLLAKNGFIGTERLDSSQFSNSFSNAFLSIWQAEVNIFSALGQLVKKIFSNNLPAGNYTVRSDGTDARGTNVASGVYFCRVTAGSMVATRKMVLLK